jgi:starch synthase
MGVRLAVALPIHKSLTMPERVEPGEPELVVIDTPELAERESIFGDDLHDVRNAERFAGFARAVVDLACEAERGGAPFDLLHLHEWPCAMVAYLAAERRAELPRTRTMLTIHNLAHQGIFPPSVLAHFGLGPEHADEARLGFHGHVNLMKGGLLAADTLTTVSPTYAREIQRAPFGEGLEGVLQRRANRLVGLLNGIDHALWDPAVDPHLAARYDASDLSGKALCKRALLAEVGLADDGRPLVVSVGRVVQQKGSDLLAEATGALSAGADLVVAGGGDPALVAALERAVSGAPRARYLGFVSDARVHRLIAAADLVLMPSRFEPCVIVQLYGLRYGAIPIATRTGGLADTIEDAAPDLSTGTGFLHASATTAALLEALERALTGTRHPGWSALVARAMGVDHGWRRRAIAYRAAYAQCTGR